MTGHIKRFINSKNDFGNLLNVNLAQYSKNCFEIQFKNLIGFVDITVHLPRLKRQCIMKTIGTDKIKIDGRMLTSS